MSLLTSSSLYIRHDPHAPPHCSSCNTHYPTLILLIFECSHYYSAAHLNNNKPYTQSPLLLVHSAICATFSSYQNLCLCSGTPSVYTCILLRSLMSLVRQLQECLYKSATIFKSVHSTHLRTWLPSAYYHKMALTFRYFSTEYTRKLKVC